MKTLVIIDAQEFWRTSVALCVDEIVKEKKNKYGIIVVKYKDRGDLHPAIESELKDYKKKTTTTKNMANGGDKVIKAARRKRFTLASLRVCGVFTDCCVAQTVQHLSKKLPVSCIEVILGACWPKKKDCSHFIWDECFKKDNVIAA